MLTSSGAGTITAGRETGVERLGPAENLEAATGRGSKPAAGVIGPSGDLAAAAAYEMR